MTSLLLVVGSLPKIRESFLQALKKIVVVNVGKPHAESDLDFMVVVPENIEPTFELMRKGNRALAGIGFSVDFIFNSPTSFNYRAEHPSSLKYKIKNEGKIVYDTTPTMILQS